MENKSHELYEKYQNNLINEIKDDSFYSYFYNLLDTAYNNAEFVNRRLVKTIDEEMSVYVPSGIQSGEEIRIENKGYKDGKGEDLY